MSRKINDLTNNQFGRLTVIERARKESKTKRAHWKCSCTCGGTVIVRSSHLLDGNVKSCGCLQKEAVRERSITHGMTHAPEYGSWRAMIRRCYDEKMIGYDRYGGRGITVCEEWRNSFEVFFHDMGSRPSLDHSIDRKDNDKGYYKDNCRWSTSKQQANNRKNSLFFEHNDERRTLPEWCLILELNYHLVRRRIRYGQSFEEAISPIKSINTSFDGLIKPLHIWCEFLGLKYQETYHRIQNGELLDDIARE